LFEKSIALYSGGAILISTQQTTQPESEMSKIGWSDNDGQGPIQILDYRGGYNNIRDFRVLPEVTRNQLKVTVLAMGGTKTDLTRIIGEMAAAGWLTK